MVVEGVRLAEEALSEGVPIREAIVSPRLRRDPRGRRVLAGLSRAGVAPREADDRLLATMHDAETHQGVLLLVSKPVHDLSTMEKLSPAPSLLLVVCGVQDPGNLGALVRLADASGAAGLVAAGGADPFGPKAVRASAGSIFRVRVTRAEQTGRMVARLLKRCGMKLAGAVTRGGADYRDAAFSGPTALFVGGEGSGLPGDVEGLLDERLSIPMNPRVESINVAAAAAILLFEASAKMGLIPRPGDRRRGPRQRPARSPREDRRASTPAAE